MWKKELCLETLHLETCPALAQCAWGIACLLRSVCMTTMSFWHTGVMLPPGTCPETAEMSRYHLSPLMFKQIPPAKQTTWSGCSSPLSTISSQTSWPRA